MGRFQKKTRRNLLLDQMKQAAAVNDAALMLRLERAIEKLEAKPRPVGIQPTSMHGKRLAAQDARSAALAARRAAYTSGKAVPPTSEPTSGPIAATAPAEQAVATANDLVAVEAVVEPAVEPSVEAAIVRDAQRQAATDAPIADEFAILQAARAAAAAQPPAVAVAAVVAAAFIPTEEQRVTLARIAERDRVAAEKLSEKITAEKRAAERLAAEKKIMASPRYRPTLGPSILLPRADYCSEGVGLNSLKEPNQVDGYFVETTIPREGCDL